MADKDNSRSRQNALRVARWLAKHGTEFEEKGISESSLATAVGLDSDDDVMTAIDYLENREEVVRVPQSLTPRPQFILKPGRGWADLRDEMAGEGTGG